MKNRLKELSLSLIVSAPLLFGQIAMAQELVSKDREVRQPIPANYVSVEPPVLVAQDSDMDAWRAYANSGYTYNDATMLANLWGRSVSQAKTTIGEKTLLGYEGKTRLELHMTEARTKALGNVDSLKLYSQSGFTYKDAQDMATFWGDASAWEGKLRIERNLILGNDYVVRGAIQVIRDYESKQRD